jgi:hypothetical protein
MLKALSLRVEDYWLVFVSFIAVVFTGMFFYAGALRLRLIAALVGFSGLLFTTYIIRRSYSRSRSYLHLMLCIGASTLLAYIAFLLTN